MGVYRIEFVTPVARALARLGSTRALVVHSEEGLDEFGLGSPSHVAQVDQGDVREYTIAPGDLGLRVVPYRELQAHDLEDAVQIVRGVLSGEDRGPHRDVVLLNAAAAIHAGGQADSIEAALAVAAQTVDFGAARQTLDKLVEVSNT